MHHIRSGKPRIPSPAALDETGSRKRKENNEAHCVDCVRIVHLIRNSLDYVSYKDRKAVAVALKEIYRCTAPGSLDNRLR